MSNNTVNTSSVSGKTTETAPSIYAEQGYQVNPVIFNPLAGLVIDDGSTDWQNADHSADPVDTIVITKTSGSGSFSTTKLMRDSAVAANTVVSSDGNTLTYTGSLANFTKYFLTDLSYTLILWGSESEQFTVSVSNQYGTSTATSSVYVNSDISAASALIGSQSPVTVTDVAGESFNIGSMYQLTAANGSTANLSTTKIGTLTLSLGTVTAGVSGVLEAGNLPSDVTVTGNGTSSVSITGTESELASILSNDISFVPANGSTLSTSDEAQIQTTLTFQETGSSIVQSVNQTILERGTNIPLSMTVTAAAPDGSVGVSGSSYGISQSVQSYQLFPSSGDGVVFSDTTGELKVSIVSSNSAAGSLTVATSPTGLVGSLSDVTANGAQTITAIFDNTDDAAAFLDSISFDVGQSADAEGQETSLSLAATSVATGATSAVFSENLIVVPNTAPSLTGLSGNGSDDGLFSTVAIVSPGNLPVTVTVTSQNEDAVFSAGDVSGVTVSGGESNSLVLKGDASDVQAALRSVTVGSSAGLASDETISVQTAITNGYTENSYTASTVVEPHLALAAPATADSFLALLNAISLVENAETAQNQNFALTIKETAGSANFVAASTADSSGQLSPDGKTLTFTGTLATLKTDLASGAFSAVDPSVLDSASASQATFTLTFTDGTNSVTALSTVDVVGSATYISEGNVIQTSNTASDVVTLSNIAAGTVINTGASTLILNNSNQGADGTKVVMSGNGSATVTETGVSGDDFVMGEDGGSNSLTIRNNSASSTEIHGNGDTQTIHAEDSESGVTVFGYSQQMIFSGGTGELVSNSSGNDTDWLISGVKNGSNQLWLGNGTATIQAGGNNEVILGNGDGLNGNVDITGGDGTDAETIRFWNRTGTTGTLNQTGNSYVTVLGSIQGTNKVSISNGIVALSGAVGDITAQNQGNVEVWTSAGTTSFTDTGSGDAKFYATGSGSFSVNEEGTSSGSLTIGVLSMAQESLSWTAFTGVKTTSLFADSGSGTVTLGTGAVSAAQGMNAALTFLMGQNDADASLTLNASGVKAAVIEASGDAQTIDATGSSSEVIVFGSATSVSYTGGTGELVSNTVGNTTNWQITGVSGGSNQLWLGDGTATINAAGKNQIIVGNGQGLNGTVNIQGGTAADEVEVQLWNGEGTTGRVSQSGESYTTVLGSKDGTSDITLSNGSVTLEGGTNNLKTQGDGTVTVNAEAGDTQLAAGGTGGVQFLASGSGTFDIEDDGTGNSVLSVIEQATATASGTIVGGSRQLSILTGGGAMSVTAGVGGLDLSTSGAGDLTLDVSKGTDHINLVSGQTGNVTISGAGENMSAYIAISGVVSEQNTAGNGLLITLSDGHTVTFAGDISSSNITLSLG